MDRELYILNLGGLHVVVTGGADAASDADAAVRSLRERGIVGPYQVVSEAEMERCGWIRKARANQFADYGY